MSRTRPRQRKRNQVYRGSLISIGATSFVEELGKVMGAGVGALIVGAMARLLGLL